MSPTQWPVGVALLMGLGGVFVGVVDLSTGAQWTLICIAYAAAWSASSARPPGVLPRRPVPIQPLLAHEMESPPRHLPPWLFFILLPAFILPVLPVAFGIAPPRGALVAPMLAVAGIIAWVTADGWARMSRVGELLARPAVEGRVEDGCWSQHRGWISRQTEHVGPDLVATGDGSQEMVATYTFSNWTWALRLRSLERLVLEDGTSIEPDDLAVFASRVEPVSEAPRVDEASDRAASLRSFRREARAWDYMAIEPGDKVLAVGHRDGTVVCGTAEAPLVVVADREDPRRLLLGYRRVRRAGLAAAFACLGAATLVSFLS